jgi:RimJ/RimL family protein N-acetyltransferase
MNYLLPERLETKRLILRIFQEEDWKDLHQYYSDEKCTKFTLQHILTEGETWRHMAGMIGHWQLRKYGLYALVEKKKGRVIGFAGLTYPNDWPGPELQWNLIRAYWGKGYASEAVMAIKTIIAEYLPELSLISIIHPCNANSQKLADNIGAFFESVWLFRGETWFMYRHRRMPCYS